MSLIRVESILLESIMTTQA